MSPWGSKASALSWPHAVLWLWLASLLLLPIHTHAAGLAWALAVLGMGWLGVRAGWQSQTPWHAPRWARAWLAVTVLALLCQTVMVIYWQDPWGERHGEIRLLLGALATWWGAAAAPLPRQLLARAASALSAGAWAGLAWVLVAGRAEVPSHPIAWAVGLAMVSVWLLAMALPGTAYASGQRRWWLAGGLAAMMAVLASRSRGAFGVVLWWGVVGLWLGWRHRRSLQAAWRASPCRRWWWVPCVALLLLSTTPVVQRPVQALVEAASEIHQSDESLIQGAQTSVGARLYLWDRSLTLIEASPWLGHGRAARMAHLQAWAEEAQSDVVRQLGHVHNEYLHQLVDHGVLGLLSQLLYVAGLLVVAWQLRQAGQGAAALAVAGVVFMHASASLSNVNFAHNYYTSVLSLMLLLSLGMTEKHETAAQATDPDLS